MSEPDQNERAQPRLALPISRQRLVELAVVVFGVMIALGLENLVEEVRLRGDARQLEKAFQYDILSAVQYSWERQAVDRCLTDTLSSLTERVVSGDGAWEAAPPVSNGSVSLSLPAPYRSPVRLWMSASFDRAIGTEAFKRIPRDRAESYSVLFASISARREINSDEYGALARLAPLAFSMSGVDAEIRVEMLQALAQLDRDRALSLLQAEQYLARIQSLPGSDNIRAAIVDQRDDYDEAVQRLLANYGDCIDRGSVDRLMALASG